MVLEPRRSAKIVIHKPLDVTLGQQTVDADLVAQSLTGTEANRHAAFEILVCRYEGFVRSMLLRLCGNRAEADDLTQEAFVTAWLMLGSLRSPASFRGWLKQLAYRQFLHACRRRRLDRDYAQQALAEDTCDFDHDDALAALLDICSPLERELMILRYGFEFTYAEIAGARNMAVGTVKSHVYRAKSKLRKALESEAAGRGKIYG
jgi:RNA polymerase sigma factor (sigma-70 family)